MLQIGGDKIKRTAICDTQKSIHDNVGMGNQEEIK